MLSSISGSECTHKNPTCFSRWCVSVKKFFKRYDLDFLLKFKVIKDKEFKDVKGIYSCVLIYMDQNKFKRWFKEDKVNKLLNKELNNMYRDYNVILLC